MENSSLSDAKSDFADGMEKFQTGTLDKTKTIFDFSISSTLPEEDDEIALNEYKKRHYQETCQWKSLLKTVYAELQRSKEKPKPIDLSILPENKISFLNQAPNLHKFIRSSVEFTQAAQIYLNIDYKDYLEIHDNLVAVCNYRLNLAKSEVLQRL